MSIRPLLMVGAVLYAVVVSEAVVRWYERHPLALPSELRACWFGHAECVTRSGYCCAGHSIHSVVMP